MDYCEGGDMFNKINQQKGQLFTEDQVTTRTIHHNMHISEEALDLYADIKNFRSII